MWCGAMKIFAARQGEWVRIRIFVAASKWTFQINLFILRWKHVIRCDCDYERHKEHAGWMCEVIDDSCVSDIEQLSHFPRKKDLLLNNEYITHFMIQWGQFNGRRIWNPFAGAWIRAINPFNKARNFLNEYTKNTVKTLRRHDLSKPRQSGPCRNIARTQFHTVIDHQTLTMLRYRRKSNCSLKLRVISIHTTDFINKWARDKMFPSFPAKNSSQARLDKGGKFNNDSIKSITYMNVALERNSLGSCLGWKWSDCFFLSRCKLMSPKKGWFYRQIKSWVNRNFFTPQRKIERRGTLSHYTIDSW